jgi:hypothetical protein
MFKPRDWLEVITIENDRPFATPLENIARQSKHSPEVVATISADSAGEAGFPFRPPRVEPWSPMTRIVARAFLIVALLAGGCFAAEMSVVVPQSPQVAMIDGKLSSREWEDAARIEVPGVARVYLKQAGGYVFLAVEYTAAPSGIVDLYLFPGDGQIYDLHASAKLGERTLHGQTWPEWTWWTNRDWVANVSRVNSWEERSFLPEPVREYQILRSRFPAERWRIRLELTPMKGKEAQTATIFPDKSTDKDARNWLVLDLK